MPDIGARRAGLLVSCQGLALAASSKEIAAMMGGNPRDLQRQMMQMQTRLAKIQEELGSETVEASVGGGMVTITMTGHQQVESVKIDPDAVDPDDVETLQDLMVAAFNEALKKSQELASTRLGALTGGMKIPGLM
jgi:DNA-binding YbaB/EbfC family protein